MTPEPVKSSIFGFSDGLVTTVSIIAGIYSVVSSGLILLIASIGGMFAGATSMFFGEYLSSKSRKEFVEREFKQELQEIEEVPEEERQEVEEIYRAKGFDGEELKLVVDKITSNKDLWVKTMMLEELGLIPEQFGSPLFNAVMMWLGYVGGAFMPLIPYLLLPPVLSTFQASIVLSLISLFIVGVLRSKYVAKHWFLSGVEVTAFGALASALTYSIGAVFALLTT